MKPEKYNTTALALLLLAISLRQVRATSQSPIISNENPPGSSEDEGSADEDQDSCESIKVSQRFNRFWTFIQFVSITDTKMFYHRFQRTHVSLAMNLPSTMFPPTSTKYIGLRQTTTPLLTTS